MGNEENRAGREKKQIAHIARYGILLDFADTDPLVTNHGNVTCFFCKQPIRKENSVSDHAQSCVWRRANETAKGIRATLEDTVESTTFPGVRATILGVLGKRSP